MCQQYDVRLLGEFAVSECYTGVGNSPVGLFQAILFLSSGGGTQLQCQCQAGMSWNGVAVREFDSFVSTHDQTSLERISSAPFKGSTTLRVSKTPTVIALGFCTVTWWWAAFADVILRCFGMGMPNREHANTSEQ